MLYLHYDFFPRMDIPDGQFESLLLDYISALHRNGQILGDWNILEAEKGPELFCIVPAEDALNPANSNQYGQLAWRCLQDVSVKPPQHTFLGKLILAEQATTVTEPSGYMVYANLLENVPPVVCVDDGLRVPLYRLPYYLNQQEHAAILAWEHVYKACDMLDLQSGVGEDFGHSQLCDLESPLSQEGLDICRDLEAKTGKPWFYYLDTYPNKVEACPGCKGSWQLDKAFANRFDLKCHTCRLVSMAPLDR